MNKYIINDVNKITKEFIVNLKSEDIVEIEDIGKFKTFGSKIKLNLLAQYATVYDKKNSLTINVYNTSKYLVIKTLDNKTNMVQLRYTYTNDEMQKIEFNNENNLLPLGSVVKLKDEQKFMITSRALVQEFEGEKRYTDYLGYLFPIGQISEEKYVFNQEDIESLLHVGMQSIETDEIDLKIKAWLEDTDIPKYRK